MTETKPSSRSDQTRETLILAALQVFGRYGFDGASTRAIAKAAGVNLALIGYHFGGKRGLYLAVFEHIGRQMQQRMVPVAAAKPTPTPTTSTKVLAQSLSNVYK